MIISHKYRFIFIKTVKTAGTSIEVFLSQLCGDDDVLTPIQPPVNPHRARNYRGFFNPIPELVGRRGRRFSKTMRDFAQGRKFYNHMPASLVRARVVRSIWQNYFTFCVERNPWDKTISHYSMLRDRAGGSLTFDDYLLEGNLCVNYPKYVDRSGGIMVDRVLRYETLMEDLADVFRERGVPFDGSLGVNAKSEHRTDRRLYRDVYTDEEAEIVRKAFAREIEMHGYAF